MPGSDSEPEWASAWVALEAAYRATSYGVETGIGALSLRIGVICEPLNALLAAHGATTWAYVSAWNPGSCRLSVEENTARHERLVQAVEALGFASLPGQGAGDTDDWPAEASLLIFGISEEQAIALGAEFGQNAIVVGHQGGVPELLWCVDRHHSGFDVNAVP